MIRLHGCVSHNAVATAEFRHRNRQCAMGFKFASKQSHNGIDGRNLVLVGHHQTLHTIVDAEHIQGIRTGEQVEDHIVLGNKTVEELDRLGIDAVIAIGKQLIVIALCIIRSSIMAVSKSKSIVISFTYSILLM